MEQLIPNITELSDTELAYIAGFFDGEGSVMIGRHNGAESSYLMRISISNTNKDIIDWLVDTLGGYVSDVKLKGNRQRSYIWYLAAIKASDVLYALLPFLRVKREHAILGLDFQGTQRGRNRYTGYNKETLELRSVIIERLSSLNRRGAKVGSQASDG